MGARQVNCRAHQSVSSGQRFFRDETSAKCLLACGLPQGEHTPSSTDAIADLAPSNQADEVLYQIGQVRLTMIVEAEWNRRLGGGFDSRRLYHKHTGCPGTARLVLGERPFVEVMLPSGCVCYGGDMGSTGRNKGYAAIRLSYGLDSANS